MLYLFGAATECLLLIPRGLPNKQLVTRPLISRSRGSSQMGAAAAGRGRHEGDSGDGNDDDDDAPPKRYLNGRITKLHNVRAEPIRDAKVVGYLIATKEASKQASAP